MLIDLYVKDKHTGEIHKIGDDQHDALWVDNTGTIHYTNLQNGDGCGPDHPESGYEFIKTKFGMIPEYADLDNYADFAKQCLTDEEYEEFERDWKKQRNHIDWEPGVLFQEAII